MFFKSCSPISATVISSLPRTCVVRNLGGILSDLYKREINMSISWL